MALVLVQYGTDGLKAESGGGPGEGGGFGGGPGAAGGFEFHVSLPIICMHSRNTYNSIPQHVRSLTCRGCLRAELVCV